MIRTHTQESFSTDLQKVHELCSEEELPKALQIMRKSLEDPNTISADNVFSMLTSLRDIQDYNAMITLVDQLKANTALKFSLTPGISHLYAFALNRRNQNSDREIAENIIKSILEDQENHNPNILCLYGRIYKDRFVESDYTDKESLDNAIFWYRKGFEIQPNEYAGINLTTLLVAKGNDFFTCPELQKIALVLNSKISEMGSPETIKNYWDVATLFECCILSKDYSKAVIAAECMFKLKPASWCLKSTIGNIAIINRARPVSEDVQSPEVAVFSFWMDFFKQATEKVEETRTRIPVLILASPDVYMPSYISLIMETKSCAISNLCMEKLKGKCTDSHELFYNADCIKSVRVDECNKSLLHLCLHQISQEHSVVFPSAHACKTFSLRMQEMIPDVIPVSDTTV